MRKIHSVWLIMMAVSAQADDSKILQTIQHQKALEVTELGIRASILDSCVRKEQSRPKCLAHVQNLGVLNLDQAMLATYKALYTEQEIDDIYRFYSTPVGQKKAMLDLQTLAKRYNYPMQEVVIDFSEEEVEQFVAFSKTAGGQKITKSNSELISVGQQNIKHFVKIVPKQQSSGAQ